MLVDLKQKPALTFRKNLLNLERMKTRVFKGSHFDDPDSTTIESIRDNETFKLLDRGFHKQI